MRLSLMRWFSRHLDEMARAETSITYALWVHPLLGLFAIRREAGTVTGVRSVPLYAAVELNLEVLPYDVSEAAIHRARDTPEQFVPFAAWQQGRVVPIQRRSRHPWLRRG